MTNDNEWWLINNETIQAVRKSLQQCPDNENTRNALMLLDLGMHKCDVKPWDM